ncbi:MAG: hypothetical protein AAFW69_04620, partial [Pseudomonadota bacterium]
MRPARRGLQVVLAALVLSALAVALPAVPDGAAAVPLLAVAILLIADLLISPTAREVTVAAELPRDVFAGEEAPLRLRLTPRRALPGDVDVRIKLPEGLGGPGAATLPGAAPEGQIPIAAARRGLWPIERLWLSWPTRLGLFEVAPRIALETEL